MKIGFIGAGAVAQSIARSAIQAGHEVVLIARRGPQALGDIVAGLGSFHRLKENLMDSHSVQPRYQAPWNKGRLTGQKSPLKQKEIWAIRIRLQLAQRVRDWLCSIWRSTASFARVNLFAYMSQMWCK